MTNTICIDEKYSTTRLLCKIVNDECLMLNEDGRIKEECKWNINNSEFNIKNSKLIGNPDDKFETVLFLPEGEERQGEGGLRMKGYFKKSFEDKPLISIITVVFNGEKYLEETMQSVINQSYDNVEYIIIDGGSTDRTLDIIKKYEDRIDYWVSEKDSGMYDGLNKGFSCAQGELINFCNADDLFFSSKAINQIVSYYNIEHFDCCYGSTEYIDNKNNILYRRYPLTFIHRYIVTLGMPFAQPTFFWRKQLMLKIGNFNLAYRVASDYDLVGRLLLGAKNIYRIDHCIIKFRKHGQSFGDKNTDVALREFLEIKKSFENQLKLNKLFVPLLLLNDRFFQKLHQLIYNFLNNKC